MVAPSFDKEAESIKKQKETIWSLPCALAQRTNLESPFFELISPMARKRRVEYPGAIYHVMNRGDRREPIFRGDNDRRLFIKTLGEACDKTDWQVHSLCPMGNHFHLVLETPRPNLVAGMKWFLGTYTSRFNRRHKLFGHLFSGRYKALIVDGSGDGYLRSVCDYTHLNPDRAGLIKPSEPLRNFVWSSFVEYLKPPRKRWPWLRVDRLLGEMGIMKDSAAGRREFERLTELRRMDNDVEAEWGRIRRGWCLGDAEFKKELLEEMQGGFGEHHSGAELFETDEAHAEDIVAIELRRLKWKEADLKALPKGHTHKVKIAQRLRTETTMTLKWIARRLHMGTGSNVANCIALK